MQEQNEERDDEIGHYPGVPRYPVTREPRDASGMSEAMIIESPSLGGAAPLNRRAEGTIDVEFPVNVG